MTELQIFDRLGKLLPLEQIEPQLANASAHVRESFENVRAAYDADAKVTAELKDAVDNVSRINVESVNLAEYKRLNYPGLTAHQATREFLDTERGKVLARNGL